MIGLSYDPGIYKPDQNGSAHIFFDALYQSLLQYVPGGSDSQIQPGLAASWSYNSTNTVLTLHLRKGQTYSDGTPVTAQSAKVGINWFAHSSSSGQKQYLASVKKIVVKSPYELQIHTTPNADLLAAGMTLPLVSPKAVNSAKLATQPDGSGPYVLDPSKTTDGVQYTVVRRKNYWQASEYPYSTIVYKVYTSATAMANALLSNQIDVAELSPSTVAQVKNAGFQVRQYLSEWIGMILGGSKQIPALGNLKVRQAIQMAFNRPAIVKAVADGYAQPSDQIWTPGYPEYVPGGESKYPYDVAKAKKLMAEAGYPNGFAVTIPFAYNSLAYDSVIQQSLAAIGIKVTIKNDSAVSGSQLNADTGGPHPLPISIPSTGEAMEHTLDDAILPGAFYNEWQGVPVDQTVVADLAALNKARTGPGEKAAGLKLGKYILDSGRFVILDHIPQIWASSKDVILPATQGDDSGPGLRYIKPAS